MTFASHIVASSDAGFQSNAVNQNVLQLKNRLFEFHQLLREFRSHEARETLIGELTAQLQNARRVENELQT